MIDKILSIIVPAYNMESYLTKCCDSLLVRDGELFQKLDVIIVNDGSTDRTSEIAHRYEARYPDVFRAIDKSNGNYGSCINVGIAMAKGAYVKILDADDTYDTAAFERYAKFVQNEMANDGGPDLFFNDFVKVDPDDDVTGYVSYGFTGRNGFTLAEFDYDKNPMVWAPAIAYKADLLRSTDYRQTEGILYTDQEWDTIPMLSVRKTCYCPEAVYRYLIGRSTQSCNTDVKTRNFAMHLPVAKKIVAAYVQNRNKAPGPNLVLVANQIKSHIRFFYITYIIACHSVLDASGLIDYDKFLKAADTDFYAFGETLSIGRFRFHYVSEWRRKYSRRTWRFRLFDMYRACIDRVHRLRKTCPSRRR